MNAAFLASVPRAAPRARNPVTLADSFAAQWRLIECLERAICVLCSRRAGKTDGLKLRTHKRSDERAGLRPASLLVDLPADPAALEWTVSLAASMGIGHKVLFTGFLRGRRC